MDDQENTERETLHWLIMRNELLDRVRVTAVAIADRVRKLVKPGAGDDEDEGRTPFAVA